MTPRLVWVFPAAFLCLMLPARVGAAIGLGTGRAGALLAAVLFVLPLAYTIPRGRAIWTRYTGWLLGAQAILTYVPFVVFGGKWAVGLAGLLGGLLLLTLPARASWPLFAAVVALEGVLRIAVFDVYPTGGMQFTSNIFVVVIDMALPLYGLVRLSDLVGQLRTARTELMESAVTQERLCATVRLREAIGDRMESVTASAESALRAATHAAGHARAHLAEAAGIARQAAEQIRQVVAEQRTEVVWSPGRTVAPRLALLVLVADLAVIGAHHVVIVADAAATTTARIVGVFAVIAIVLLQLRHSLTGAGRWTLALQVLLLAVLVGSTLGNERISGIGMASFPAGSALLLLSGWSAWLAFTVIASSVAVHWMLLYPGDAAAAVYLAAVAAATGLAVYGLSRLTELAEEMETTRRDLAYAAAQRERLRVAQDSHDLLGLGLAAVALKCDLAGRLIGRDDARARAELGALIELAQQTHSDVQKVTAGTHDLSFPAEVAAARQVLASAGVEVHAADVPPLPEQADAVLATVLREAVTNVLRHARATRCDIELVEDLGGIRLRVVNDGVIRAPGRKAGRGLQNLKARAAAMGGRVVTRSGGNHFEVTVRVPLPSQPAVAAGDPDGVHPVAGTQLGHG